MPAVTARSGCHVKRPPLPDECKLTPVMSRLAARQQTFILSLMQTSSRQPQKHPRPRRRAGPKSVMIDDDNDDNDPQESSITRRHPPPKPRPLARSKCSGPMTSSAEEEIFEATPALVTEAHSSTAASKDPNPASEIPSNDPNGGTSATPTESHNTGHGSKDHGKDTSAARAESHSTDDGRNNSATPATGRPCRSCGIKSYAPDHNDGKESSPSDSDWGANQEQRKKAQRAAVDAAANDGDDNEGSPASNPLSPSQLTATQKQKSKVMADVNENIDSEDEDDEEDFVKTKGRIPQACISKAQELGKNTLEAARVLGKEYGKSARTILIEAGLTMKATQKESPWNQHQTWFAATCPPPKGVSGAVSPADLKAWKHASVWKEILENWDRAVADSTEDLTSQSAAGLMMAVRDAFTKLAAYWHCTHGIHIAGVAILPGDEEAGHQASGLFAGSDMVKALINSHQLDIKCWLDELTTILKYKDLEAAHTEGKTFSLLPPSSTTPNSTLLCNGKPARDRNRKVAPMMISEKFAEAGHPLKSSNSVPLPGPDFDLKALSASQLCALVAPYLRIHLGALYEAELGLDNDNGDSEADAVKAKKRKGKSKKSGNKGRKKGPIVEEPSVVLHISRWPESDILAFEMQASNACLILLVIDTDGRVIRTLQDLEKFIKDLPPDNTPRRRTNELYAQLWKLCAQLLELCTQLWELHAPIRKLRAPIRKLRAPIRQLRASTM
ncbi:hypothetical protein EV702DRAFT_1201191 [Suillus placidus]|uniref:Uncharacterized protein n=1 Tax=Suillus placidus TaxID=48579 RepID=A0A9P6ZMV4_9AGAM|nr:hypothetical protein EV702DRAFT_1201191 [Suillus placidus]